VNVAELVARHARDERRPSGAIVLRPSADELAGGLTGGPVVRSWDQHVPDEPGTCTVVEVIATGKEGEQIADLAAVLGDTDVALLLFKLPPEALHVGVVTDTLTRQGLTVLEACGTTHRSGRTAIVVSRDAERPQRAYLSGTPIPDDEASRLRQRNEWVIEGLQLRSSIQVLERRVEGQAAELLQSRSERRLVDQELTEARDLTAKLGVAERERAAAQTALALARRELAARPSRIRKAALLLADDPVQGSRRIVRAIGRRLRR
jgi:hypothetical protein